MAANSSAMSKSSPDVSYLQIYKSWLKNDRDRNGDSTSPVEVILDKLVFLLTKAEYQMVDKKETDEKKLKVRKIQKASRSLYTVIFYRNCSSTFYHQKMNKDSISWSKYC